MVTKKGEVDRRKRKREDTVDTPPPNPTTVCYCNGERDLGTLELQCSICRKWFHQRCFKDLLEFYGLPFMVCYVFKCKDCSPDSKETWTTKQTNFSHMCVMAMANMVYRHFEEQVTNKQDVNAASMEQLKYFHFENDIVKFFDENWECLSSTPKRKNNTWHQTLLKTLMKETDLFAMHPEDENMFALKEQNLLEIGPLLESVKKLGKRPPASQPIRTEGSDNDEDSGPKTRNAAKRRAESSSRNSSMTPTKASTPASTVETPIDKPKTSLVTPVAAIKEEKPMGLLKKGTLDANAVVEGSDGLLNFPFNREGMQYFFTEKDIHVKEKDLFDKVDAEQADRIPPHIYRWQVPYKVTLSLNDRAYQTKLSEDRLSVTGDQGYIVARGTHPVMFGKWYFEVEFLEQPEGSHARIGWGQNYAHLQACLGYSKFSYSWRSLKGTKFHNAHGYSYFKEGYGKGDVLGCLIELPEREAYENSTDRNWLPPTKKKSRLLNFKGTIFFEEKEEIEEAERLLVELPGTKITFFKNGISCGTAFENIYKGPYYPAVSMYQSATLKCNFGPDFKYPPPSGVRPVSDRAEEMAVELALADMLYLSEHKDSLDEDTKNGLSRLNLI
uniref:B30.2/SPRY domain-containing protein n=1 Tax=Panagrolaimus sp. JU765 TaxID=591449 RepID=A0AC34QCP0_9BILA